MSQHKAKISSLVYTESCEQAGREWPRGPALKACLNVVQADRCDAPSHCHMYAGWDALWGRAEKVSVVGLEPATARRGFNPQWRYLFPPVEGSNPSGA